MNTPLVLSPRQRELLRLWQTGGLSRLNILEGAVSSGKTWASLALWALWTADMPPAPLYLMCAKSLAALKRNCLLPLQGLVGADNFRFSLTAKEGRLFGRRVLLEGAGDARAQSKIRGVTLQGAYCDELTQLPEEFFAMLLSRLRLPGARLFATTNPDAPGHWLMRRYLSRADQLDLLRLRFTMDDNPTLTPEYRENLKKEYSGVFYHRFIQGEWAAAQGLVYPMFDPRRHVLDGLPPTEGDFYVSADYGIQNPNVWLLWRQERGGGRWLCLAEDYYSGRDEGRQLTDSQLADRLDALLLSAAAGLGEDGGEVRPRRIFIDPSAASMKAELRRRGYHTQDAKNQVLEGIAQVCQALGAGRLAFAPCCQNTLREFGEYLWDAAAAGRGLDAPRKENDHAMDAVRYFVQTARLAQKGGQGPLPPVWEAP